MEVHAHAHTPRKKWTHFLWEFVMLFLAVFAGFMAENAREKMVERHREKEYMESMLKDLKTDHAKLEKLVTDHQRVIIGIDSLLNHFDEFSIGKFSPAYELYASSLNGYTDFIYTDRTIDQLKSAGNMRLIRHQDVSDSITYYDSDARDYLLEQTGLQRHYEQVSTYLNRIFNFRLLKSFIQKMRRGEPVVAGQFDFLLTHDKQQLEEFYNTVTSYRNSLASRMYSATILKESTKSLQNFIKEKYGLSDE